jgi:hypothetical protein
VLLTVSPYLSLPFESSAILWACTSIIQRSWTGVKLLWNNSQKFGKNHTLFHLMLPSVHIIQKIKCKENRWNLFLTVLTKVKKSLYRPGQALGLLEGWGSKISRQLPQEGGKFLLRKFVIYCTYFNKYFFGKLCLFLVINTNKAIRMYIWLFTVSVHLFRLQGKLKSLVMKPWKVCMRQVINLQQRTAEGFQFLSKKDNAIAINNMNFMFDFPCIIS